MLFDYISHIGFYVLDALLERIQHLFSIPIMC